MTSKELIAWHHQLGDMYDELSTLHELSAGRSGAEVRCHANDVRRAIITAQSALRKQLGNTIIDEAA